MKLNTIIIILIGSLMPLTLTGCSVMHGQQTVGAYSDDVSITIEVKRQFLHDPRVSGLSIDIDTIAGIVQLSGFAKNLEEKNVATHIARHVYGVKDVRNNLVIR